MYKVRTSSRDISENTTISPSNFGGWLIVNNGTTGNVYVDGYKLEPGDGLNMTDLHPDVIWDQPIRVIIDSGAIARFTSLRYTEVKKEDKERE